MPPPPSKRRSPSSIAIERAILALLAERGPDKSICPSEVARKLDRGNWRAQMQPVRDTAFDLARRGLIEVTQRNRRIAPATARGPIRLRLCGRRPRRAGPGTK